MGQEQVFNSPDRDPADGITMPSEHKEDSIDYVEFAAPEMDSMKAFYGSVFGWLFTDYGPDYADFETGSITGGFSRLADAGSSPLVVLYARDLESKLKQIVDAGGEISRDILSFPGGRRFQFRDPCGNELAIWSDGGCDPG